MPLKWNIWWSRLCHNLFFEFAQDHLCSYNYCTPPFAKAGDIKTHSSIHLSVPLFVRHKNCNLAHMLWSINDRALIFDMHDPYDKPFHLAPCCDLDLHLDLLQDQNCCRAGDNNSPNLLVNVFTWLHFFYFRGSSRIYNQKIFRFKQCRTIMQVSIISWRHVNTKFVMNAHTGTCIIYGGMV